MTGIEKITARITADAEAECAAVAAGSEKLCAEIRAANERRSQERYWALVREGVKETEQQVQRVARTAKLDSKKSVLAMKQELVSRAFELAKERITGLPEQDYAGFLAQQAAEAAITGEEELIFNDRDRRSVGAKVAAKANELLAARGLHGALTVSEDTRGMSGGLIMKQGDIEVNCTVDTLLELSRGELAARVAEVLFEA